MAADDLSDREFEEEVERILDNVLIALRGVRNALEDRKSRDVESAPLTLIRGGHDAR